MAIRSVMKPGCQPLDAGLSGTTPGTGQARPHRHAVARGVGQHLEAACAMSTPDLTAMAVASAVAVICAA